MITRVADDLREQRLVTLTGTGGVGKTRLSSEVATVARNRFADGVWVVDLATTDDRVGVVPAIASLLAVPQQADQSSIESIVGWLQGRRALLLLDNCEHVRDAVAELAEQIVGRCADVRTLATSREPLAVHGERVVTVRPLSIAAAVDMFRDRATAADDSVQFSGPELHGDRRDLRTPRSDPAGDRVGGESSPGPPRRLSPDSPRSSVAPGRCAGRRRQLVAALSVGEAAWTTTVALFHTAFGLLRGGLFTEALTLSIPLLNEVRTELGIPSVSSVSEVDATRVASAWSRRCASSSPRSRFRRTCGSSGHSPTHLR